jgi:hypothetical protein
MLSGHESRFSTIVRVTVQSLRVSLSFIVGNAGDVFAGELAGVVDAELRRRWSLPDRNDPYESEPVDASGWRLLQQRVLRTIDSSPQLASVDAYQAVYVPAALEQVEHLPIANLADPLQIGSLPLLLEELKRFASAASLPTDDLELMSLAAHYLEEEDPNADLDVQTYVQLMLSAKQAMARGQALWIVV